MLKLMMVLDIRDIRVAIEVEEIEEEVEVVEAAKIKENKGRTIKHLFLNIILKSLLWNKLICLIINTSICKNGEGYNNLECKIG